MLSSNARLRFMAPDPHSGPAIAVVYSAAPRQSKEWVLQLAAGETVGQALDRSVFVSFPALDRHHMRVGIRGKNTRLGHALREGDRLEVYRDLRVDPKAARRERFNQQGAKTTGLFATRRVGAKAGY